VNRFSNYVGKVIWNRERTEKGTVVSLSERRCAVCGRSACLIVEWSDGKRTKPCLHGIGKFPNGELFII